jgi:hypothetical protein
MTRTEHELNLVVRQDSTPWILFMVALLLYAIGILWGLPHATAPDRLSPWGSDELAPIGPLAQIYHVIFHGNSTFDPRYPLLPYAIQALVIAPYLGWLRITGGLGHYSTTFPYGLADPVRSLATMTLIARASSLLLMAAVPALAWRTAAWLWNRRAATFAGIFTLFLYPLAYYARTSNVDAGGLFWTALGLLVFAKSLRYGLTRERAVEIGIVAALAVATKDQNYAVFLPIGIALVVLHVRTVLERARSEAADGKTAGELDRRALISSPLIALATAVVIYLLATGLLFRPDDFARHLNFILYHPGGQSGGSYFSTPATFAGYASLATDYVRQLADAMSWPLLILALAGVTWAGFRAPRQLLLALPVVAVFLGVIMPVRFVRIRFVLPAAYTLALFAAAGLSGLVSGPTTKKDEKPTRSQRLLIGLRNALGAMILLGVAGWTTLRSVDLTQQMLFDSRNQLRVWLQRNAIAGDHIGYYGAPIKLPPLAEGIITEQGPYAQAYERPEGAGWPEFIVIIPQQPFEVEHEWNLPEERYAALKAGQWNYDMMLSWQASMIGSRRPINWVNPPVRLFVRRDILSRLRDRKPMLRLDQP